MFEKIVTKTYDFFGNKKMFAISMILFVSVPVFLTLMSIFFLQPLLFVLGASIYSFAILLGAIKHIYDKKNNIINSMSTSERQRYDREKKLKKLL